ncbi:MAG: dockerin type I repeat-containing protein [Prevotella sp.]|nr:dockerin type I repeat-containing protein [Prevotella sp.]
MKRHLQQAIACALFLILTFATAQASNMPFSYDDENEARLMPERQLRGDVNGDGDRTIVDVTMIVNYILSHEAEFELWIGDLDGDNAITIVDVTIMVNIILGADYNDPDNPDLPLDGLEGGDPGTGL